MAVLTVDSLTGCSSIPSFLGGSGDTPSNPSIMIFHQTSAPTPWTKDTSAGVNNIGLRVIGGANGTALSSGGTLPFTQTFTSRSVGPFTTGSQNLIGTQITQATVSFSPAVTADMSGFPGATQPATVTAAQTAIHGATHTNSVAQNVAATTSPLGPTQITTSVTLAPNPTSGTSSAAAAHSHPIAAPHTHQIQVTAHSHNSAPGAQGNHNHTYSSSYDFSIYYVDIIIATKN